jgi:uncharacterized protein YbcI
MSGTFMKTQGEMEAATCAGIAQFEREYMGRGPKDIQSYLIDDMIMVRLTNILTAAEQQLVKSMPPEKGRDLLKQVRTQLIETSRKHLEALVHSITDSKVVSIHHDISTVSGEEIIVFTLDKPPKVRDAQKIGARLIPGRP